MFAAVFKALKRVFDNTLAPMLIAVIAFMLEKTLGLMTWIFIKIADLFLWVFGSILSWLPLPDVNVSESSFGAGFMDMAQVMGLWPALGVMFSGALVALIARLLTFGIVGNK